MMSYSQSDKKPRLFSRQGLYKYQSFPAVLGKETSGTIVALPTDESVLSNETFKKQGYKIGGKVAAVGPLFYG